MFDLEKLTQSVAYLLRKYNGQLNYTKLIKLMYLADKEAMRRQSATITGDDYFSLNMGPVASRLYNLIKGEGEPAAQKVWNELFEVKEEYNIAVLKNDVPRDWISDFEIDILDDVDSRFHNMEWNELVNWTHDPANCPEWKNPHGSSIPITKEDMMKAVGFDDEYIAFVIEDDAIYEEEEQYLKELENRA